MLSFIFVIVRICADFFYRLFIYVLPLVIQLSRGIPLTGLTTTPCLCISEARIWISNVIFWFSELRWEVIVRFVDIGGIFEIQWVRYIL